MEGLAPSTVNVGLSAMRKVVCEARASGVLGVEEAARFSDVPNIRQQGTRLGNWLAREQAKELLAVPDRSTLKGKRDYVILALLVGCALRQQELATLNVQTVQMREGRWVLADLVGKEDVCARLRFRSGSSRRLMSGRLRSGRLESSP